MSASPSDASPLHQRSQGSTRVSEIRPFDTNSPAKPEAAESSVRGRTIKFADMEPEDIEMSSPRTLPPSSAAGKSPRSATRQKAQLTNDPAPEQSPPVPNGNPNANISVPEVRLDINTVGASAGTEPTQPQSHSARSNHSSEAGPSVPLRKAEPTEATSVSAPAPKPPPVVPKKINPASNYAYDLTDRRMGTAKFSRSWMNHRSVNMFTSRVFRMFQQPSQEYAEQSEDPNQAPESPAQDSQQSPQAQPDVQSPTEKKPILPLQQLQAYKDYVVSSVQTKGLLKFLLDETLIYPDSKWLSYWDFFLTLLVFYTLLVTPYVIGFDANLTGGWYDFDMFVDACFLANIIVSFRTVIIEKYEPVLDNKRIAIKYIQSWFLIDLIAGFPSNVLVDNPVISHPLGFIRLVRLSKLKRIGKANIWASTSNLYTVMNLSVQFALIAHWLGCGWYLVGRVQDFPDNSFSPGASVLNKSSAERYMKSLSWGFVNLSGLGSNLTPETYLECILTMIVVIVSLFVFATIIGSMNSAIENLDRTKSRFRDRLQSVNEYMRYRRLPESTKTKVRQYYERIWFLNQGLDEKTILDDLPRDLRLEVAMFVHKSLVQKVPLFRDADEAFIRALTLRIKPELCLPGDFIFRQGERGAEMYFLGRGKVEIIAGDGVTILTVLGEGAYFGEIAILANATRTASVRAVEACELFVLQKVDFDDLLSQYPAMSEKIRQVAQEREKNKAAPVSAPKTISNVISALRGARHLKAKVERHRHLSASSGATAGGAEPIHEEDEGKASSSDDRKGATTVNPSNPIQAHSKSAPPSEAGETENASTNQDDELVSPEVSPR